MNRKFLTVARYFTLILALLAALSFAACGQTFSGQNTFLTADAGEVEISGTALKRFEYEISSALNGTELNAQLIPAKIEHSIENLVITKHTGGEGSFTYNLVFKKGDKALTLPLSSTYGYATHEEYDAEYRDAIIYISIPYTDILPDGRLFLCSYEGVFFIDTEMLTSEKFEFGRLPIEAPFVIKGLQLGYDGKFTLLANDKEFDYIIKLDENKDVAGYKKVALDYKYLYSDERPRLFFNKLISASDSYEYFFEPYRSLDYFVYYDGETDKYYKLVRRSPHDSGAGGNADKMIIYTLEITTKGNCIAVATYDNGETIRFVKFDGNNIDGVFQNHIFEPSFSYKQDIATYYLAPNVAKVAVNFATNTASVEYNFTKDMLAATPFAYSSDGRYELYSANFSSQYLLQTSHAAMYDTKEKEITYLSVWNGGACPKDGHAGFFKNDDIYLQQRGKLLVFNPETAQQGPTLTLNLLPDFGISSEIHTFRRDPDDKSFAVVYSKYNGNAITYSMAFYSADGELLNNVPGFVQIARTKETYVELSIAVSGKTYTVKGYDDNDKLVVHFDYTVGDTSIINRI